AAIGLQVVYGANLPIRFSDTDPDLSRLDQLVLWTREAIRLTELSVIADTEYETVIPLAQIWKLDEAYIVSPDEIRAQLGRNSSGEIGSINLSDAFPDQI